MRNKLSAKAEQRTMSGPFKWIVSSDDCPISEYAIPGGYHGDSEIFVARAQCNDGSLIPGLLTETDRALSLCHEGKEKIFHDFEVFFIVQKS